jgi:hypothetical protein
MENKEKAEIILELLKHKADHCKQTRDIEFKVNISIWTLIALIGYFGKISTLLYICIAIAIFIVHFFWMILIQNSEDGDHCYMEEYRKEIEKIVGIKVKEPELEGIPGFFKAVVRKMHLSKIQWIIVEILMTGALLIGVGFLICQNNQVINVDHEKMCDY